MSKLFKRGLVWHAWVPKGHGKRGKRKASTGCTDKRAAESVAATLERQAADPMLATAQAATTAEILEDYYRAKQVEGLAPESLAFIFKKCKNLRRLLPPMGRDITYPALERYARLRLAEWAKAPVLDGDRVVVEGRHVMRASVIKEFKVLKPALRLARKRKKYAHVIDDVFPKLRNDSVEGTRSLSAEEIFGLALVLPRPRMALIAFAAATGCDPGALCRVRKEDVAADFSVVQIHGKKRKSRERPAHLPLADQRTLVAWALKHGDGKGGLVFSAWQNMWRDVGLACAKLGIPRFNRTDLRRTYGTWLRDSGIEPQLIAPAMGHANSLMVERVYGKLKPEALGRLMGQRVAATEGLRGSYLGRVSDGSGASGAVGANNAPDPATTKPAELEDKPGEKPVRRGGIEPPTRGFSVGLSGFAQASKITNETSHNVARGRDTRVVFGSSSPGAPAPWVHEATANLLGLLAGVAP